MPKRPTISAPKFGAWLQLQRGSRSLEQIAKRIRRHVEPAGLKVNPSLLHKIERGRVPNWPVLLAFAHVYAVPIEEIFARLSAGLEFPGSSDLIRHTGTGQQAPHPHTEEADVPASAQTRIRELLDRAEKAEQERDVYRHVLINARELVNQLATVIGQEGGAPSEPETTRRRAGRKNH